MQTHSCLICKHHTVLTFSKLTARIKKNKNEKLEAASAAPQPPSKI